MEKYHKPLVAVFAHLFIVSLFVVSVGCGDAAGPQADPDQPGEAELPSEDMVLPATTPVPDESEPAAEPVESQPSEEAANDFQVPPNINPDQPASNQTNQDSADEPTFSVPPDLK